jgi:hypothetical protein
MQRVLEHSLIRNRDTLGVHTVGTGELLLLGPSGHYPVQAADTIPVPPLASVAAHVGE